MTEPLKPFLDVIIVSSQMHVYVSQTDRGEILVGAEIEPYTTYRGTSTFPFLEYSARHALELFPQLESARVLRQWTGLCDISPDFSPILGVTEVDGFLVSAGWGTYGFKAAPIVGTTLAELVATKRTPTLIAPFALERFCDRYARLRARGCGRLPLDDVDEHTIQPRDRASRAAPARSRRWPRTRASSPTRSSSTGGTRRSSISRCSTGSRTSPTGS